MQPVRDICRDASCSDDGDDDDGGRGCRSRGGDDDDGVAGVGWCWWYKTVCHSMAYIGMPNYCATDSVVGQVRWPALKRGLVESNCPTRARCTFHFPSPLPLVRTHGAWNFARDRDRLISNEHKCMADGSESASDREFVQVTYYISSRERRMCAPILCQKFALFGSNLDIFLYSKRYRWWD